ncbi:MAG: DUF2249 domain-containing protein [Aromatoleum sp.]|jgi:uncharacterized protein (DUF2249 family)|uniref:DUF2249 domain-containing protein n=1 Tax=Aromatoleum sp. TaxID=2307007 RepID=UPI0028960F1F|nr:DUF2249 domain-containing protein [Aromatoleum sp.]MDT3672578.1 DUF2249 domain-containing protein [Aromatoleum sp.]
MTQIVDGRGLEPPQPFELVMEALADLPAGGNLTVLLDRMPYPLFRILDRDGYRHNSRIRDDGVVEIEIAAP